MSFPPTNFIAESPSGTPGCPPRLRSMTGFGVAAGEQDAFAAWTVSVRSFNHRYLDLRVYLPDLLLPLERRARAFLQEKNPRGHVELKATLDLYPSSQLIVDDTLADKYLEAARRIAARHRLPFRADLTTVLQLPGVLARGAAASGEAFLAGLEQPFLETVRLAVERWDASRAEEAAALLQELRAKLAEATQLLARLEQWQRDVLPQAQDRLTQRIQNLLHQLPPLDPVRLAQEAALLAERADTTEEVLRLRAHLTRFDHLLQDGTDSGRRLDFLLQEMNREANTLLSKVAALGEPGLPPTRVALDLRAVIEKLREQIQNVQ